MKYAYPLFLLLVFGSGAWAQDFDYLPAERNDHQVIEYTQFTLSYNEIHEQADWVAYELTEGELEGEGERCGCFDEDENIWTGSAEDSDYRGSGFDRGHLAPSADNRISDKANRQSFYFSNITPQAPPFNQGLWADLEEWVRQKTIEQDTVYVVTGPVFTNSLGTIGENDVTIPGYFYKALLGFSEEGEARTTAFLVPHIGAEGDIEEYVVPVNTVETLTGLDLFPELGSREEIIESNEYESFWGL